MVRFNFQNDVEYLLATLTESVADEYPIRTGVLKRLLCTIKYGGLMVKNPATGNWQPASTLTLPVASYLPHSARIRLHFTNDTAKRLFLHWLVTGELNNREIIEDIFSNKRYIKLNSYDNRGEGAQPFYFRSAATHDIIQTSTKLDPSFADFREVKLDVRSQIPGVFHNLLSRRPNPSRPGRRIMGLNLPGKGEPADGTNGHLILVDNGNNVLAGVEGSAPGKTSAQGHYHLFGSSASRSVSEGPKFNTAGTAILENGATITTPARYDSMGLDLNMDKLMIIANQYELLKSSAAGIDNLLRRRPIAPGEVYTVNTEEEEGEIAPLNPRVDAERQPLLGNSRRDGPRWLSLNREHDKTESTGNYETLEQDDGNDPEENVARGCCTLM